MAWVGFIFYASTTPPPGSRLRWWRFFASLSTTITQAPAPFFSLCQPLLPKKKRSQKKNASQKKRRYDFYSFFSLRSDRVLCVSRSLSLRALMILFSLSLSLFPISLKNTLDARAKQMRSETLDIAEEKDHTETGTRAGRANEKELFFLSSTHPPLFLNEKL
jgi:hypothetical protein